MKLEMKYQKLNNLILFMHKVKFMYLYFYQNNDLEII